MAGGDTDDGCCVVWATDRTSGSRVATPAADSSAPSDTDTAPAPDHTPLAAISHDCLANMPFSLQTPTLTTPFSLHNPNDFTHGAIQTPTWIPNPAATPHHFYWNIHQDMQGTNDYHHHGC